MVMIDRQIDIPRLLLSKFGVGSNNPTFYSALWMILTCGSVWRPLDSMIQYFYSSQMKFSSNYFLIKYYSNTVIFLGVVRVRGTPIICPSPTSRPLAHQGMTEYNYQYLPIFYSPPHPISILDVVSFYRDPINTLDSQLVDLLHTSILHHYSTGLCKSVLL